MKSKQNENIDKLARMVYVVSRCSGLFPFSIVYNANGGIDDVVVKTIDIIWFIIAISVYALLAFVSLTMKPPVIITKDSIVYSFGLLQLSSVLFVGMLSICLNLFQRNKVLLTLKQMRSVDDEILRLTGATVDVTQHKRFIRIAHSIIFAMAVIVIVVEQYSTIKKSVLLLVGCLLQHFILSNVMANYLFLLLSARHRYAVLNRTIRWEQLVGIWWTFRWLTFDYFRKEFHRRMSLGKAEVARCLRDAHDRLGEILNAVNACWSVQVRKFDWIEIRIF